MCAFVNAARDDAGATADADARRASPPPRASVEASSGEPWTALGSLPAAEQNAGPTHANAAALLKEHAPKEGGVFAAGAKAICRHLAGGIPRDGGSRLA